MGLIYLPERGVQGWFLPDGDLYWDAEHPLLKDALIAQALVNGQWVDLLTGRKLNAVGSTATYPSRGMGRVVSTGATSTSYIDTGVTPNVTEAKISYIGTFSLDSTASGDHVLTSKSGLGNGGGLSRNSSSVRGTFEATDTNNVNSGEIAAVPYKLRPFCVSVDDSTVDFYWGGIKATTGSGAFSATTLSGTQTLCIGRRGSTFAACSSNLIIARQEKISDRQYEEFVSAPFAMFHQRRIWVPVSGSGTTQALTGEQTASTAGTVIPAVAAVLTGSSSAATAGTIASNVSTALTGVSVTPSAGTLVSAVIAALSGEQSTTYAGVIVPATYISLLGQESTAAAGTLTPVGTNSSALTGSEVSSVVGVVTTAITVALTGAEATVYAGTVTPLSGDSVALIGISVSASAGTIVGDITVALVGAYSTVQAGNLTISGVVSPTPPTVSGVWTLADASVNTWTQIASINNTWED